MDEGRLLGSRILGESPDSQVSAEEGADDEIGGSECARDSTTSLLRVKASGERSLGFSRNSEDWLPDSAFPNSKLPARFTTEFSVYDLPGTHFLTSFEQAAKSRSWKHCRKLRKGGCGNADDSLEEAHAKPWFVGPVLLCAVLAVSSAGAVCHLTLFPRTCCNLLTYCCS